MTSKNDKLTEESPIKNVYDFLLWLYFLTGAWRIDESTRMKRILYNIYKLFTYASYFYHLTIIYLGTALLIDNFQMLSFGLTYFIIANVGVTKMILFERHIKNLKKLENRLQNNLNLPWLGINDWEKIVKKESAQFLSYIVKAIFISAAFAVTNTLFLPIFPNSKLTFVIPTPFNHLSKTILFIPIYMHQSFSLTVFIMNFVTYDFIFIGLVLRLCDHLEIIKLNLKQIEILMETDASSIGRESGFEMIQFLRKYGKIRRYEDAGNKRERMAEKHERLIKNCIAHHQAIFREIKLIGNIFSYTTFIYVFCGPFLMALLTYVILLGTGSLPVFIQQASFVIPAALFLFMQCYFGTKLSSKCEEVRFAFYDYPWYEMDVRTRKLILCALTTMEKNGKFRAGNFVDVSLKTFLTTLKTSYNIVAFLKNTS